MESPVIGASEDLQLAYRLQPVSMTGCFLWLQRSPVSSRSL